MSQPNLFVFFVGGPGAARNCTLCKNSKAWFLRVRFLRCHTTYPSDVNGGGNSPKVIGANFETGISMHFYKFIEVKYDVI